ncbi:MAG: 16S rRNA (guanine(527)-N(7))-methyltransferase RsmG [Bacteroidales bacterium]|nr:16S rRNA (guanine(527)-N(7))-methyltransferase RsmG [Bacteroidales bacterium]
MFSSIQKYFPSLTHTQQQQFVALGDLYHFWNEKINVVSRKDIENIYTHHILHSLSIGLALRMKPATRILDAGTGGGLPGIPLAILFPDVSFTLIDSVGKKIRVVTEIGKELNLSNIQPRQIRLESMTGNYHFVTGRAVTDLLRFYQMARKKIAPEHLNDRKNGILYLSGGDIENQLNKINPEASVTPLSDFFTEPYFSSKKLIYIPVC